MKLGPTKRQDRANAVKYRSAGRSLLNTARDLAALDDPKYCNAVAILAIHAAIAYSDALATAYRGIKSVDGDHVRVADTLMYALGNRADPGQVVRLRGIPRQDRAFWLTPRSSRPGPRNCTKTARQCRAIQPTGVAILARNSAFVVPALAVGVIAGFFLIRQTRETCKVRWRVGEIDPRFNISAYEVQNAASNAAAAWNAATDERVLWYDKREGIPLNLVYDAGHPAMAEYIGTIREIRRLAAEIDNLTPQYEKNPSQYVADRVNRSIDQYNRLITSVNQMSQTEIKQGSYQDKLEVYAFADTADLKIVIAHEFGHALGIGHVDVPEAVMNARNKIGAVETLRLHAADIAALKGSCSR